MSIHVYSPLDEQEVRIFMQSSAGDATVELKGNGGLIETGQTQVNFSVEPLLPDDFDNGMGAQSKVNFFAFSPFEGEKKLQAIMSENPNIARIMRAVIDSLKPLEVIEN